MKTAKKVIVTVFAMVHACGTFAACSGNDGAKEYKISVVQLVEHVALDTVAESFKQEIIDEIGEDAVDFDIQNGQNDANTCSTIANQFVSSNVDIIMANALPRCEQRFLF